MKRYSTLTALLARLSDPALADSMIGDLVEARRRRGRLWFAWTTASLVAHFAVRRIARSIRAAPSTLRGSGLAGDVRQSARALVRTPVTTLVIVLTLGLGFGLNTAIFSIVHSVLFDPFPFDRPDELMLVQGSRRGESPGVFATSYPDYRDLRAAQTTFRDLAIATYWNFTVTGTNVPLRLVGQRVSGSFFPLLGMRPEAGRWIDASDDVPGGPEVVVLSHGLWQREFGRDAAAVGHDLTLNGVRARIIGVMPAAFRFPFEDVELWTVARNELDTIPRNSRFLTTLGRLRPGVRAVDAEADLARLAAALETAYPDTNRDWRPSVRPAVDALTVAARPRLMFLFGAALVVLVVACVNVTTLLRARASARQREFALRASLGASRARLLRVTFVESAWLGGGGLVAGMLFALPAVSVLRSTVPATLPRLSNVGLHWTVFGWAALGMFIFVIASAIAPPGWRRRRPQWLRAAAVTGAPRAAGRRALIVVQVAGAFALLAAAGLLVRSFTRVLDVDPGFDPSNAATVRVFLTPPTYRTVEQQIDYVGRALETLRSMPGVVAASAVSQPPFDTEGAATTLAVAVEGRTYAPGSHPPAAYRATDAAYFEAVGMRVLEGRTFSPDDRRGRPLVAVINESMARQLWPGERAIGRRFEFADGRGAGWLTVVGVVNDVATDGLEQSERPAVYAPFEQRTLPFLRWMTLVVRTGSDVTTALPSIRARLQAVDPNQPLYAASSMAATMAASLAERRFSLMLMLAFAVLTLTLSALGVYGTLAQRVAERRREIGVRLALGARPGQVFRAVMGEGAALVTAGAASGALVVIVGVPLIRESLFGISPADAWTYVVIALLLAVTTILATLVPSTSAARTDPVRAIKGD
jgi:predicted permease